MRTTTLVAVLGVFASCGCSHDWDPFDPRGGGASVAATGASSSSGGPGGGSSATSTSSSGVGGTGGAGSSVGGGGAATGGMGGSGGGASGGGGAGGSGGGGSGGVPNPCGPGSTGEISDDFDDGVFAAIWDVAPDPPVTVEEKNGQAVFTIPVVPMNETFASYISQTTYDMTECHMLVHAVQMPSPATNGYGSFGASIDSSTYAEMIANGGELELKYSVNDMQTTLAALSYDVTEHAWWRLRGSGGDLFWETSKDGQQWMVQASAKAPFSLLDVYIVIAGGTYQPEPVAPGEVRFDDFNLPP